MAAEFPSYSAFRSGYTFTMIRRELAAEATAAAARGGMMHVTRRTVLGRWRQRKLELYEQCRKSARRGRR